MSNNTCGKKVIVILGPTACGKTKLAVKLADFFNGEIVSADSRQVYQGMDIGTGKDLAEYIICKKERGKIKKINIPYHLIDIINPKKQFNLADYQKLTYKAIDDILKRGKIPFLVGGTGLYLQAITDGLILPEAKPNRKLRKKLEKLSLAQLLIRLKKLDPKTCEIIDKKNKRRLIRAIEICLGADTSFSELKNKANPRYQPLILGISFSKEILDQRIDKRLKERLAQGMVEEVKNLHQKGLSWKRLEQFGLEYKFIAYCLQGKLSYKEMAEKLKIAICQFAKRQMTWFKGFAKRSPVGNEIIWISSYSEAKKLISDFFKKKKE